MKHHVRRLVSLAILAGLLTTISAYLAPTNPAGAAPSLILISGNFFGDARDEFLEYRPGSAFDQWQYDFRYGDRVYSGTKTEAINGTFKPVAGDFDGDGYDEIFWHSPNANSDSFWDFDTAQTEPVWTSVPAPPVGVPDWILTVGDFSNDGTDDIFFYRPGAGTETIWDFPTGSLTPTNLTPPHQVNTTLIPSGGHFADDDADDITWYNTANGAVTRWDFEPGDFTTSSTGSIGTGPTGASPITLDRRHDGGTDLYLYTPNATGDQYWDFSATGNHAVESLNTKDPYTTTSGDYFGDNGDDIYWTSSVKSVIWDYYTDADGLNRRASTTGGGFAATSTTPNQLTYTVESDELIDPN